MENTTYNLKLLAAPEWMVRESRRMTAGIYTPLPENVQAALDDAGVTLAASHYVHVSMDDAGKVAFTENYKHGYADRQTRVKFGKYLARFHRELDAPTVAKIAGLLRGWVEGEGLKIAESSADIREVYENGPSSCMAHDAYSYDCDGVHPTEVYGGPDTAVAYVTRGDRVTARAVLNLPKKRWARIYGDKEVLQPLLEAAGYRSGDLAGCRCLRMENDAGDLIFPYVDGGADMVTDTGEYLVIDYDGEYNAAVNTNGLLEAGCRCGNCGDHYHSDDMHWIESEDAEVCEYCLEREYYLVNTGGWDNEWFHMNNMDDVVETPDGEWWTRDAVENSDQWIFDHDGEVRDIDECVFIEDEGEYYHTDEVVEYIDADGDTAYLPSDREDELVEDAVSGEMILEEDAVECAHGWVRA